MVNYSTYCPACGFESPENAKFCRQCGAPLMVEGEQMEPVTRNYGRQGPAAAGSAPLPPSIGDAVAGDTYRYQQPLKPLAPAYTPPGIVSPAANTTSLRSKRRFLKLGGLILALFLSGGIGAAINQESNRNRYYLSSEDRVRLDRLRTEDRLKQTLTSSIIEYHDREREQLERRLEEIYRAKDEAQRAAERGDLASTGEKLLDFSGYEYQGASTGEYSRIPGRELLVQRTKDDFDTVSRFYQEKLGVPFVYVSERNQKQSLFQSIGPPSITVLVRESRDRLRQPEIIILRSPFRFNIPPLDQENPKADQNQKATVESKQTVVR